MDFKTIKVPFEPGEPLSQRVARGGVWVFALRMISRGLALARIVVLARLLSPNDFGLMGIALLTISILETFSQTGFRAALVQKKEDIEAYLDTAWTVSVIRGVILFFMLFLITPHTAHFFDAPSATPIIRLIGLSILLRGFTNIGVVYFQKEFEFNRELFYQLGGDLAELAVTVPLAFILRSVWALVFGALAGGFVSLIMSYVLHPYRPSIRFEREKFEDLFNFGKWILCSYVLTFLLVQGDDIFVGKLLGVTALGFYQMAYSISNLPATEITEGISRVTFPAYSKLQDNLPRLREAYLRVLHLTTFLSFPVAGMIFILAPHVTEIFLGEKWMPMVPAMQALALFGLLRSIEATAENLLVGVGKPRISTKLQFLELILLSLLIYPFTVRWGILGTCLAVISFKLGGNILFVYIIFRITKCSIWNWVRVMAIPLVNTLIMLLAVTGLNHALGGMTAPIIFILAIFSIVTYAGISYAVHKICGLELPFPGRAAGFGK